MATASEKRDRVRELMKGIDIAMFTTIGEDGFPVSRPLSTQDAEFDGRTLWFFVRRNSAKVAEIARYPRVNVAYASQDSNVYLSVAGTASIEDEQALIDRFWSDAYKAFFPGGRTDPQLVLIRVDVATIEYWDGPSSGIGKAVAFVISRVTRNDDYMGENHLLRIGAKPSTAKRGKAGASRKAAGAGKSEARSTKSADRPATRAGKAGNVAKAAKTRRVSSQADARPAAAKKTSSAGAGARKGAKRAAPASKKPTSSRKTPARGTGSR